jgi:predicted DNA-binding transcriptional regulator YafY
MPRNDQVIRQWDVLQALSSAKQGLTLDDLLTALPEEYARHTRTLRRDLEALEVAGFPLINERVDGRVRWRLLDGFGRIPARTFSPTEIMALVMSQHLLKPLDGTQVQASLESALKKAAAALPLAGRELADQMQGVFSVGLGPHKTYWRHRETIGRLTQAIAKQTTIQMRYDSASRGRVTRREVDPYRLWYVSGGLYTAACDENRECSRSSACAR